MTKRMGESVGVLSVDWATNGTKDVTVVVHFKSNAVDTGRFSSNTLNEASKPKTAFNHRTGFAPTTPGVLPITVLDEEFTNPVNDLTLAELKELAKSKGLKGYSTMKKAELVALLKGS